MSEFTRNLAVVIGINNYGNGIPPLATARKDAERLGEILKKEHNYQVTLLVDKLANREEITRLLTETLPQQVTADDRLLFYFAGHGIALNGEEGPEGYLIPQDAKLGNSSSYLPMTQLQSALSALPCRHFLGILDCCFAGAFRWSSTRDIGVAPEVIHRERYDRFITDPAWQVITSAASDQKAADAFALDSERGHKGDHSPFAAALIEALKGQADAYPPSSNGKPPGDGVITATELYLYLRDAVEPASEGNRRRQTPGIWPLKKHDKGEYIFLSSGHPLNLPPAPPLDASKNPYRGLESFEEEHRDLFFGRTASIAKLYEFVSSHTLTVVLGASGSGKSSLVKAGLIPYLKQQLEDKPNQWQILAPFRPGESPLKALNNTLARENLAGGSITQLDIEGKVATLSTRLADWSRQHPNTKMLLVIDQFEELITLCKNEQEREKFLTWLEQAVAQYPEQLRLVFALRSDFEPQFRDTALKEYWNTSRFVIPAMKRADLREAIEKPAEIRVMYFQPHQLVEQLIDEVAEMPGALPLLSFALSELYLKYLKRQWDGQNAGITIDRALTQEDYQDLGGVIRSLTQRADQEYEALLEKNPAYAQIIRQVMLRMIALEGGELARRRAPLSELKYQPQKNHLVEAVIECFDKTRLLVKGEDADGNPYVEPAHDALVRGWQKLLMWKQEEEESLPLQRRLTQSAEEWESIKSKEQLSGFQAKAKPVIDWLDRKFYFLENLFNKATAELVRLLRRRQNQQERSRNKDVQFLWDTNPYLNVLDKELNSDDNWLNQLETEFVQRSVRRKHRNARLLRGSVAVVVVSAIVAAIIFNILRETAQKNEIRSLVTSTGALYLSNQEFEAFVQGLTSGTKLKPLLPWSKIDPQSRALVQMALIQLVYKVRESNLIEGHTDKVNDVSFSPDGKTIASVSDDGTIRLWSLDGGQLLKPPSPVKNDDGCMVHILSLSFSPDSRTIATTDDFNDIKLWSWDGKQLKPITSMKHKWGGGRSEQCAYYNLPLIKSVSFSRDGTIASADDQGIINLWGRDGQLLRTLQGHKGSVNSVSFSPDGQTIASADDQGIINLWRRNGLLQKTFKGHDHLIKDVSFSPDSQTIASADDQGIVKLWSRDGQLLHTLQGHNGSVNSVSFSPDNQTIATGGNDRTIKLWSSRDGQLLHTLQGHNGSVNSVSFDPNGQTIVTGSDDRTIRLWSRDDQPARTLKGFSVSFSPDGAIISADKDEKVKDLGGGLSQWYSGAFLKVSNLEGKVLKRFPYPQSKDIIASDPTVKDTIVKVNISLDGAMLTKSIYVKKNLFKLCQAPTLSDLSEPQYKGITLWSLEDKQPTNLHVNNAIVSDVSFSPDGQTIATATDDGIVILWSRDGQKIRTLAVCSNGATDNDATDIEFESGMQNQYETVCGGDKQEKINSIIAVSDISFSPHDKTIASACDDGTVKLWSRDGQLLETLEKHDGSVNSVNFSPDGQIVASADDKGIVKLWSRDGIKTFQAHASSINNVSFSPDSQIIATASNDGNVKLWSRDGQLQAALQGPDGAINNVSFSPDGKTIAAASKKGTITLWNIDLDDLLSFSCDRVRGYLETNPNVSDSNRRLCDDVPKVVAEGKSF